MAGLPPNFFDLCRTCKKPTPKDRKTLFNEEISAFIENYPSLKCSDLIEEKLPRVFCNTCFEIMDFVNKFVTRAERVKGELEKIISNDSSQPQPCSSTTILPLEQNPLKRKFLDFDQQNGNANSPVTKTIKASYSLETFGNSTTNYLICKSCKIIFHSVGDATIHQMNHDHIVHMCLVCNAKFNTPSGQEKHSREDCREAEKNAWTCSLCSYFNADWNQVKSHMMAEHKPCNECNLFWRECLASAKQNYSKLCSTCGNMNEYVQGKDSSLPIRSQESEDAGIAFETGTVEQSQSTIEEKQETVVESVDLSNDNTPVPYEDAKEVWVVLEKLSPETIKRAMLGNHGVDLNKVKIEQEELFDDCDGDESEAEFDSTSSKKNDNILIVKLPKKSDRETKNNKVTVPENSKEVLKCKYCKTNFTQQLHYIKHLRQYHL